MTIRSRIKVSKVWIVNNEADLSKYAWNSIIGFWKQINVKCSAFQRMKYFYLCRHKNIFINAIRANECMYNSRLISYIMQRIHSMLETHISNEYNVYFKKYGATLSGMLFMEKIKIPIGIKFSFFS